MSEPQIVFENVIKRFGDTVAVDKMNFSIEQGEFLTIMGSSGCGKTTTLRMLAGLETPSEGEIRLAGKRINEIKPSDRNTPLVWQSLALFPFLNVIENVEFGLKMRRIQSRDRKQRAMKWLERMEISEFANRPVAQLSGGQRQRVALARALVTEPPVLLLDEPLSALDANLVVRMQGVLSRLQKELGITFVYVTHSQSEAFAMADRVVIMSQGVIEQIGTPKQVFREPATRFVAEFVGSNNILSGIISKIENRKLYVDTGIGLVIADQSGHDDLATGNPVDIVISADRLNLHSPDFPNEVDSSSNKYRCKLVSEEFIGAIVTLLVETENGVELKIQKQQKDLNKDLDKDLDNVNLETGQPLWVSWPEESVYIVPAKQSAKFASPNSPTGPPAFSTN
ncbi:ABC transporter ATP-binding protein [Candidatus Spongiihabitans sp.]|uniref:ABC transporter ATP-binding protein n=1 Tax=Candidatus Spongiihabitans sp. TaxID=3101308 RepID=UPI003C7D389F